MNENLYSECRLCPRNCGTDRHLHRGYCGCYDTVKAARAGLHYYEEPFISGANGSGTVFFTGCSLGCVYCQNTQISHEGFGLDITPERLSAIFLEQQARKAHNINIVTGTHFTPSIALALQMAKNGGLTIPVVWNSSGYEKPETLSLLDGLVDIFMPDFKTMSSELGSGYFKAPDYPERAKEALDYMVRMTGSPEFVRIPITAAECQAASNNSEIGNTYTPYSERSLMKRGVTVRHLVIPGHTKDSMNVLKYLYDSYGDNIWISVMGQYTPVGIFAERLGNEKAAGYPELQRTLTRREYDKVVDYAINLGIKNCMIQEYGTASDSFIPLFDGTGIAK